MIYDCIKFAHKHLTLDKCSLTMDIPLEYFSKTQLNNCFWYYGNTTVVSCSV